MFVYLVLFCCFLPSDRHCQWIFSTSAPWQVYTGGSPVPGPDRSRLHLDRVQSHHWQPGLHPGGSYTPVWSKQVALLIVMRRWKVAIDFRLLHVVLPSPFLANKKYNIKTGAEGNAPSCFLSDTQTRRSISSSCPTIKSEAAVSTWLQLA